MTELPVAASSAPCHCSTTRLVFSFDRALEAAIADAFGVAVADLHATTRRNARAAFARQTAIYLAHVVFGQSYRDAGRLFGRDRTTASHACRLVEERREDPLVDALVGVLEQLCGRERPRAQQ
jgi:hypothetical protein